jgi:YggT family protein
MIDWGRSLVDLVGAFFASMAVLRYLLEVGVPNRPNPLMKLAVTLTEFALQWIRPVLAALPGRDRSALFWAWFLDLVMSLSHLSWHVLAMEGAGVWHLLPWGMALAVVDVVRQILYVWMAAVFLLAVLSWVNPYSPLLGAVEGLVHPFLRVLRRFIRPLGSIDLSPVILMLFFQFSLTVGVGGLEMLVQRLM